MDTTESIKPSLIPKIPKKWKWSGDLFISSSEHKAELLCHVTIKDLSESSDTCHMSILLSSSVNSLRISKLYPISELSTVFRACEKAQYFGKLESTEANDEVLVQGLKNHMSYHKQAAVISLLLDQTETAILVIFPATLSGLAQFLQVPDYHISDTSLLVVLLPLVLSFHKSSSHTGWRSMNTIQTISKSSLILKKLLLSQAMSFLQFPKSLLEFLDSGGSSKSYCICFSLVDLGHSSPGLETTLLQVILQSTKANLAKLEEDVRVIFIHVGAFASIQSMSGLVAKRANSPETQFFTYGSHPNVDKERWGLHEIFPLGGIVTFTATAITENPVGCNHLMLQISEHPFWECYVVPEVLGAIYLLENGEDQIASPLFFEPILDLIDSGSICMGNLGNEGPLWLSQLLKNSSLTRHQLLEECSRSLKALSTSSSTTIGQLVAMANEVLTRDLAKFQLQPVIMDNYRRFVVIRAISEAIHAEKDGFEWCPLTSFEFKDDFF
ncbi:hypothetical protein F5I97DRAFT_1596654 [Phlebopus sp. FC_14]|nr:hypothetical protein F5I97DRAFT_1596654 [Phlebopus sp. FC_14]